MEFSEVMARRRMVRRFDPDRAVPEEALEAVLAAACRAPSAGFTQAVGYLVLTGADVADYWALTADPGPPDRWLSGLRTASVLILVWTDQEAYLDRYAERDKGWTDRDPARWSAPYWWIDAGMGVMAALLTAVDAGLGACFFGIPPERLTEVRRRFDVPASQASVGVLGLGYSISNRIRSGPAARPGRPRRARDELVHRGRWESR